MKAVSSRTMEKTRTLVKVMNSGTIGHGNSNLVSGFIVRLDFSLNYHKMLKFKTFSDKTRSVGLPEGMRSIVLIDIIPVGYTQMQLIIQIIYTGFFFVRIPKFHLSLIILSCPSNLSLNLFLNYS